MRLLHAVAFFKVIRFVGSNQGNNFENATACSKRTLKTLVATQLKGEFACHQKLKPYKCRSKRKFLLLERRLLIRVLGPYHHHFMSSFCNNRCMLESISSAFYAYIFCMKVLCATFLLFILALYFLAKGYK